MPWTPEMTRPYTYNNNNIYRIEEYWSLDANFTLQYVCDYEYNYIDINAEVGLADVEKNPLNIFPNPTNNSITITGLEEGTHKMEIIDMSGRVVKTENINNSQLIDLSALQEGCYLVKVQTNKTLHTAKVIVK